jgi:hypothetical protein
MTEEGQVLLDHQVEYRHVDGATPAE